MICSKCTALPLTSGNPRWSIQHHTTFAALDTSARIGCQVCTLLKAALLDYYAKGLSLSMEEATRYHRQLDQHPEGRGAPKTQDSETAAFFVEAIDSEDSEPQFQGLRGVTYLRIGAESRDPIDDIFPFVQVSSLPGWSIPQLKLLIPFLTIQRQHCSTRLAYHRETDDGHSRRITS